MKKSLSKGILLQHYKRSEIQDILVQEAQGREIGVRFLSGGFGKRPDVLQYPHDVLEFVKKGVSSFHASEERWSNPLLLGPRLRQSELHDLRTGWDLILDIDCEELEYSKIAADLVVNAIAHHDIESFSVKFSGNHGFHIGVPFETFPEQLNAQQTASLFPHGPRKIASYLRQMIREPLAQRLLQTDSLTTIAKKTKKQVTQLMTLGTFDPFTLVDIDTVLIASRHLYRMPYSFNEKSGLVSVPVHPKKIMQFSRSDAKHTNIEIVKPFITVQTRKNEATRLFVQAFDATVEPERPVKKINEYKGSETAIPEEYFPPCINCIAGGLQDGKKRAMFVLSNFLSAVGWSSHDIEQYMVKWNERNTEPVREVTLQGHLRHHQQIKKKIPPPNCANHGYYRDLQICHPDAFCKRIKNPANYSILKQKIVASQQPKKRSKKKNTAKEKEKTSSSKATVSFESPPSDESRSLK
ncbi:hypothetical protein GF342_01800 [Candidatus Woesearchaeota archaeon]|nr:hypothetical protein [Candidatus Woesearchaeota archaeon]